MPAAGSGGGIASLFLLFFVGITWLTGGFPGTPEYQYPDDDPVWIEIGDFTNAATDSLQPEMVTIVNTGKGTVLVGGWELRAVSGHSLHIPVGTTIPRGGSITVVMVRQSALADEETMTGMLVWTTETDILRDEGDTLSLFEEDGHLVDMKTIPAVEGLPGTDGAPEAPEVSGVEDDEVDGRFPTDEDADWTMADRQAIRAYGPY